MRIVLAAAALALLATPALACGWGKSLTVEAPQTPSTVATDAPSTPVPAKPQG